jgi:hypothetical protein
MAQKKTSPSSISSAGSEDLALDLKEPELFKQLPSVSKTPSAKPSCASTGPKSRSTTTLEPSTQIDLEELTSSAAGFPASLGVSPGSSEARKMTVTSGRSWFPLLKSYGLNGSLAKMCEVLLANRWASSAAFLTWKASGIKPRHLLFQLAPSMPRTDATGSGLWLTPTASESVTDLEKFKARMKKYNNGTTMPNLATQVSQRLWPTPRSCSAMAAENIQNRANDKFPNLESVVARTIWPTPTANEDAAGTPAGKMQGMLGNHPDIRGTTQEEWSRGSLNPTWVEWLMGFPIGHTDLKPSEMPSSRKSSRKSAKQSSRRNSND